VRKSDGRSKSNWNLHYQINPMISYPTLHVYKCLATKTCDAVKLQDTIVPRALHDIAKSRDTEATAERLMIANVCTDILHEIRDLELRWRNVGHVSISPVQR
jgi:hypothetical protein